MTGLSRDIITWTLSRNIVTCTQFQIHQQSAPPERGDHGGDGPGAGEYEDDFLDTVAVKASNKDVFVKDVSTIKSLEATSQERENAERRIMAEIKKSGELVLHGDVGVVERVEGAKRLRDTCTTARERLDYVKLAVVGMMHLHMNMTIQNVQQRMPHPTSTHDKLSLANIRTASQGNLSFFTNDPDTIKVGSVHCTLYSGRCSI